jgi:hypothetical protein
MKHSSDRKLNWVDFSILISALALIVSILLRTESVLRFFSSQEEQTVTVSFLISDIADTSARSFDVGDTLYFNNLPMGELESKSIQPAKRYLPDAQGILQICYADSNKDVLGTLVLSGLQTEQGFYWNHKTHLSPGQNLSISTENQTFQILILDIAS